MVGNYVDGYELGKDNGSSDYRSGNFHDSKCPPNDSLSWCTGYKIGYEVGWTAAAGSNITSNNNDCIVGPALKQLTTEAKEYVRKRF